MVSVVGTNGSIDYFRSADNPAQYPEMSESALNFDCARAFVRIGPLLVGMVVAGAVTATDDDEHAMHD